MRDLVSHVRISFTEIKSVGVDERREHHAKPELDATLAVCINRRSGDKSRWNEFPHIWPRDIKRLDAVNRGSLPCRVGPSAILERSSAALGRAQVDQLHPIRGLQTHPQPPVPLRVVTGDPVVPGAASLDVEGRPPPVHHPRRTVETDWGGRDHTVQPGTQSPFFTTPPACAQQ